MDLVLTGGTVHTMDRNDRTAEAVGVENGKITAVGTGEELARTVGPDTKVVQLAGRTLIPGFIDGHNHFSFTAFQPVSVDCSVPPHSSIASVLDAIAAAARGAPKGRWIWGWGFRDWQVKENRYLTRGELDEVAPDNPVCILDKSCHACYANSAALKLANMDRNTPDPAHGRILKDDDGEPSGTLWEAAMSPLYGLSMQAHLEYQGEQATELVRNNAMRHLADGITSVGDALVTPEVAALYRHADAKKDLPIRMHQMFGGDGFFSPPEKAAMGEMGDGNVSDRLRGGTVKIFMDPVFPDPALICHHDDGTEEDIGEQYYTQEEVDYLVLNAHKRDFQLAIHCLGTRSIDLAMNSIERAMKEHPRSDPRFRIEHFSYPTLAQTRRMKSLNVVASMQPSFIMTRGPGAVHRAAELGGGVLVYPYRTILSEGVMVTGNSDSPCTPVEPLKGLYCLVHRRGRPGSEPVVADEAITPLEALRMYTANSAYAMSRESEIGSLEVGKRADMVVLSHDPAAVDPEFILEIKVDQSYVDGELLYQR